MSSTLAMFAFGVFHHAIRHALVWIVLLSLASAASYGLGAVFQHRAAIREAPELSLSARLVVRLAHRPLWVVGNGLDGAGYVFQFLALRNGSLTLVEPLLVLSLVFALPVAAWLDHRRISRRDVVSIIIIAIGLAVFLGVARPGIGHPRASGPAWAVLTVIIVASCGAMVLGARGSTRRRAVLLAAGSGIAFGYVAAVTERTGHLLDAGVLHALTMWEPYALIVGGVGALLLTQSAFHAGELRLSLPTLTVVQPLVAVAIGLGFFGEHADLRGVAPFVEALGVVLVVVGVFLLARSPLIAPEERALSEEPE